MPPVGQNTTSGKGPPSAFSIGMPPAGGGREELQEVQPVGLAAITSLAVATPGSSGRPARGRRPTSAV
jgi:hypothetical protein